MSKSDADASDSSATTEPPGEPTGVDIDVESPEEAEAAETANDATGDLIASGESPECPECGSMSLYFSEGCKTCESCGWSEC